MGDGFVIPSLLEREQLRTRKSLDQINAESAFGDRGFTQLGDGLVITRDGRVIVKRREEAPTKTELECMSDLGSKFASFLMSEGAHQMTAEMRVREEKALAERTNADPVILDPGAGLTPSDLANEFGTPVDTTEIIALCEETSMLQALPEVVNGSKIESWREMSALVNCSGTAYIGFTAGECPDFICDTTGTPSTVDKKHIGKMQSLTESDIKHSIASIAAGYGVRELIGPPNTNGTPSLVRAGITSLMDKEIKKLNILVLNALDFLNVKGDAVTRTTEFSGFENYITSANGARVNVLQPAYSGTFSATRFDEWIAAACARPTHVFGHNTAIQALKLGYWGLGANSGPAQVLNFNGPGTNIVPGLTFADTLQTAIGNLTLVSNSRFTRTEHAATGEFSGDLFTVRMAHNGEPLIYRATQIPLSYKELAPGCSAVSFMVWTVTALIVKFMCAQGRYTARFQGKVGDGCSYVFG